MQKSLDSQGLDRADADNLPSFLTGDENFMFEDLGLFTKCNKALLSFVKSVLKIFDKLSEIIKQKADKPGSYHKSCTLYSTKNESCI